MSTDSVLRLSVLKAVRVLEHSTGVRGKERCDDNRDMGSGVHCVIFCVVADFGFCCVRLVVIFLYRLFIFSYHLIFLSFHLLPFKYRKDGENIEILRRTETLSLFSWLCLALAASFTQRVTQCLPCIVLAALPLSSMLSHSLTLSYTHVLPLSVKPTHI